MAKDDANETNEPPRRIMRTLATNADEINENARPSDGPSVEDYEQATGAVVSDATKDALQAGELHQGVTREDVDEETDLPNSRGTRSAGRSTAKKSGGGSKATKRTKKADDEE